MSGLRPFGVTVFRDLAGVRMFSLGVHVELHTPTVDLHLPGWTVQVGRNNWDGRRFVYHGRIDRPRPHTDNCDHPR